MGRRVCVLVIVPVLMVSVLMVSVLVGSAVATLGTGAGAAAGDARAAPTVPASGTVPTSIVQLGDSVAAGEGTLYGYRYDSGSGRWVDGNLDATWPGPYPDCHTSPDAYGTHVAAAFGARFTQFACTGAEFDNGIATSELFGDKTLRPPQFGNWATQVGLNAGYDAARPDLVLVTLGADDVHFVKIVTACVENALEHAVVRVVDLECTRADPGSTVRTDFFDRLAPIEQNFRTLVQWIDARAEAQGTTPPRVVFTTYPDPLPAGGAQCPDSSWLRPSQLRYLSTLVTKLNRTIRTTVSALHDPKVAVADTDGVYTAGGANHRWCSKDPWAYGLSVFHLLDLDTLHSQAPFHPTPRGQRAIAARVVPAVRKVFSTP